jgi:hypothetical protein
MIVKPVDPAAVIRDPHTLRQLPAEGGEVPESSFWIRRLLDGDVIRVDNDRAAGPTGSEPIAPLTTRRKP